MTRTFSTGRCAGLLACSIALTIAGCGGGGGGSSAATGTLNLGITDGPVDDADAVWIEFTGVEIKPASGDTIDITYAAPKRLNLLALTGGVADTLVDGQTLPAGKVNWIRVKVNAEADMVMDSYIEISGSQYELRVPSGAQTGLKLNRPITIPDNGVASFTVDFDLRKSVHERSGNVYMLRPTLRLVDNSRDGALEGSVDPATVIAAGCVGGDKAAVYVFEGNVTPDDVDGNAPDPVSTARVDWESADYDYRVGFLEAGTYTAAFTCDAGDDEATSDDAVGFTGTTTFSITAGQTRTVNF